MMFSFFAVERVDNYFMTTILYIEQDEAAQQYLQSALGSRYNLISAHDGPMAVQYCAMIQPDLIIMGLILPEMEGHELAARLKMFMPQTPILVVTGEDFDEYQAEQLTVSTNGFISKPIDLKALAHSINSLLPPPTTLPEFTISLPENAIQKFEEQIDALNRANKRLASLNAISALIGTSLDIEHLMDEILAQVHKAVDFDSATLLLLKGDVLEAAASRGFSTFRRGMNVYSKSDHNSAWRVVSHKLPLIIKDVHESSYWEARPELVQIQSWLGVPLIYKDRVVGVLTLDNNASYAFTDADARYVFTLAYQTAIAVENTQLFEEWEDQSTRLKLINEVTQEINMLLDVDQLFNALARAIFVRLDYERVAILEVDETRSGLVLKALYGDESPELEVGEYRQDINEGLIGKVMQSGQSLLANDGLQSDETLLKVHSDTRSVLVIPIFINTQIEAVLIVEKEDRDGFGDQDLWTLSSLVNQAATAIKNAWLYRSLDAYSDKLERTIEARTQRLQAIKKMSQVVSQGLDIDELLTVVGQGIGQIFAPDFANSVQVTIGLVDGSRVQYRAIYGPNGTDQSYDDQHGAEAARGSQALAQKPQRAPKFRIDPRKLAGHVIIESTPKIVNQIRADEISHLVSEKIIESLIMAPLITGGKTIGLIMVESQMIDAFDDSDLETLETLAFQVASAIEHARLLKKTREIAIVEERTRLARDMHDGVAQNLAYLLIQVDRCLNKVEEGGKLEEQLMQISKLLKQNIDELRRNIFDLRPVDLEGESLFRVLDNFVTEFGRRWKLRTTYTINGQTTEVPPEVESSLYRILQEAFSNARQHAHCTQLDVVLGVEGDRWVTLEVKDDGRGFDASRIESNRRPGQQSGLGLVSMHERAGRIGGELVVESLEGQGTRIFATLPLHLHAPNGETQ
jgi:signal transduction histidine kinase/CheY-like chemotaxis protein